MNIVDILQMFWIYKFGFDIGIIERTWNWNEREI